MGAGYHLIGENEWLTMAENILQVAENDLDKEAAGMQLATTSPNPLLSKEGDATVLPLTKGEIKEGVGAFKLTNDNIINNFSGAISQWTNQNVTSAGLPVTPSTDDWSEYSAVTDYQGLNIAPDYYLTDAVNHIGKIYTSSKSGLKGFVRGAGGIYGLDLSRAPDEKSAEIGFRCAK